MASQTMTAPACDIHHTKAITFNSAVYNVQASFLLNTTLPDKTMSRQSVLSTPVAPLTRGHRETPTSPTVSPYRIAWTEVSEWNTYRQDVFQFFNSLPPEEHAAIVDPGDYMAQRYEILEGLLEPTSELGLRDPIQVLFHYPHNRAARPIASSHVHASIKPYEASKYHLVGDPDYVFVYDERVVGAVELKTFWSVTARQIDEVFTGAAFRLAYHAGRLAVQQLYGYLTRNALAYGVLTTMNGFVFMVRHDLGRVSITRLLPCDSVNPHQPTMLQWLYMFSAHSVSRPFVPETDGQGSVLTLEFSSPKHPSMDSTARVPPPPPPPNRSRGGRVLRAPGQQYALVTNPDPPKVLFEPWKPENQLGPKTFLVQLVPGDRVVAKVWDGWKHKSTDRDIEAEMLLKLQPLWGKTVPTLIGTGEVDFLWTVLIEHIHGRQVSAENINRTVATNIILAFQAIHELGVVHGDVRQQNILVKEDDSVVIIDFERSQFEDVRDMHIELEDEMVEDLLEELQGHKCPCSSLSELAREAEGQNH